MKKIIIASPPTTHHHHAPPKLKVKKQNCCCCVCASAVKFGSICSELRATLFFLSLPGNKKETFWALVSEIKLWIQFSIDISPLPLCLSISIFLYFHLSSSSQCFTEHVELEGSFCCSAALVCVCVCRLRFFHFGPFSPSKRCCVWCGTAEKKKNGQVFELEIGKEDEKKKTRRR